MWKLPLFIYKVLLGAFPRKHPAACRHDLVETLLKREAEVRANTGRIRVLRFWARELLAVLTDAVSLRLESHGHRHFSVRQLLARVSYDSRYAIRSHRRSPVFAIAAVLTIALGIGATTIIFSFVNGIILSPLPYHDPAGIVTLRTFEGTRTDISEPEYLAFRSEARALESIAAARDVPRTLQLDEPQRIATLESTHELFGVLGVSPRIGRTVSEADETEGAARVAVLSHRLWREMFASDPGAVGEFIRLDGMSHQVIGVMPAGFHFPSPEVVLWTAYQIDPANPDNWNNHYLDAYARLADGVSIDVARAEIRAMGERFVADYPEFLESLGFSSDLELLFDKVVGGTRTPFFALLGAVWFLLLIGCTNVATLLLARGENRKQEIAIRSALGASRQRVVMQLLMESLVLAVAGGVLGILLTTWGIEALRSAGIDRIPRIEEVSIDVRVVLFAAVVTALTGILFGLLPAITGSRADLQTHLKEGARSVSGSRRGSAIRRSLVAAEVALAIVLVIGAGIMLRSIVNLQQVDTGFRTDSVLSMRVSLPNDASDAEIVSFFGELVERVEALPGVVSAGAVWSLPLHQGMGRWSIQIEGKEVTNIGEAPTSQEQQVTPGYFQTMNLSLLEGRLLTESDNADTRMVSVVNEAFAERHWPGETAVGRQIKFFSDRLPWIEIVGVVQNTRQRDLVGTVEPKLYLPLSQTSTSTYGARRTMSLVVHGHAVEQLVRPVRSIVNQLNSAAPVYLVQTMDNVKSASMADRSYPTILMTLFAILALFLASVGIYGMVAFHISQCRHSIGVHLALGATSADVRLSVLKVGLTPVLVGIVVGLVGAVALMQFVRGLLYQVSPVDPAVYVGMPVLLIIVAASASMMPAVRVSKLDPADVLRAE